jgi:DNA-binding transcriptional ArsR family regulator
MMVAQRVASGEADVFAALASPARRELLMALRSGPRTVSELGKGLPIARSSVSEHLQALRACGLVGVERQGRERIYYLDPRPLTDIGSWLNGILVHWTRRLDDLEAAARRERARN